MLESRFCYRISAKAGFGEDKNGNNVSIFSEVKINDGLLLEKTKYDVIHERYKVTLSKQLDIPVEYIECISQEEFDENEDDDE